MSGIDECKWSHPHQSLQPIQSQAHLIKDKENEEEDSDVDEVNEVDVDNKGIYNLILP